MDVKRLLSEATASEASDIFIIAGRPLTYKRHGKIQTLNEIKLLTAETTEFVTGIYHLAHRPMDHFEKTGDDDFSFAIPGVSRYRVSAFKQRGSYSAVIRVIAFNLPQPDALRIPDSVMALATAKHGMVLVTGPAGSGKSTTLACIIDKINKEREEHIITLEDPLEYLHRHEKSIVSQREVSTDTEDYITALRSALRQSPDVILLGDMRGSEVTNTAINAAESGHLIFTSLHTIGAANTIERIIDIFPASQQHQICIQLAPVLRAVVSQKLLPAIDGGLVPAFEIVIMTPTIRNLIREHKIQEIDSLVANSTVDNIISMDTSIYNLYTAGIISQHTAIHEASHPEQMARKLSQN